MAGANTYGGKDDWDDYDNSNTRGGSGEGGSADRAYQKLKERAFKESYPKSGLPSSPTYATPDSGRDKRKQ